MRYIYRVHLLQMNEISALYPHHLTLLCFIFLCVSQSDARSLQCVENVVTFVYFVTMSEHYYCVLLQKGTSGAAKRFPVSLWLCPENVWNG